MSGLHAPKSGPDYVAEYQISPIPWATSSYLSGHRCHRFSTDAEDPALTGSDGTLCPQRDRITTWVMVKNRSTSSNMQVGFTERGLFGPCAGTVTASKNFIVKPMDSVTLTVRVSEIWISGSYQCPYSVCAGLNKCDGREFVVSASHGDIGVW